MASRIRDVVHNAEGLIETGNRLEREMENLRIQRSSLESSLADAYAEYGEAENNEDWLSMSNAEFRISSIRGRMEDIEQRLEENRREMSGNVSEREMAIRQIDGYTEREERNLSILQQLKSKAFSKNANQILGDIAGRVGNAQAERDRLLQSLGQKVGTYVSALNSSGCSRADSSVSHPVSNISVSTPIDASVESNSKEYTGESVGFSGRVSENIENRFEFETTNQPNRSGEFPAYTSISNLEEWEKLKDVPFMGKW